ncbi:MAG: hypothetical protein WCY93_07570 [Anaerolineaceae bacterium]
MALPTFESFRTTYMSPRAASMQLNKLLKAHQEGKISDNEFTAATSKLEPYLESPTAFGKLADRSNAIRNNPNFYRK